MSALFDVYRLPLTKDTLHTSKLSDALEILAGGVRVLPAKATGGCLSTEFWLADERSDNDSNNDQD